MLADPGPRNGYLYLVDDEAFSLWRVSRVSSRRIRKMGEKYSVTRSSRRLLFIISEIFQAFYRASVKIMKRGQGYKYLLPLCVDSWLFIRKLFLSL